MKMWVSGTDFVFMSVSLALWTIANPGSLRRLATVSRPWAAMNGLEG